MNASMTPSNEPQIAYWNGRAGAKWSAMQVRLDAMLAPVTVELKGRAGAVAGQRVLDIGCGTGQTCMLWLDGGAEVTGVDISAPMLALAAKRTAAKATLVEADASVWRSHAPFDLAVSRFGVMFFDAPEAAFANIAANIRPGGRLLFACWRAPGENPWATAPMAAIRDLLPEAPPPDPNAPGPFAFASADRVRHILEVAGFTNISIDPFDFPASLAQGGGVDEAVHHTMELGPSGAALAELSDAVRALAATRMRAVLAPYDVDGVVALPGATWMVTATRA